MTRKRLSLIAVLTILGFLVVAGRLVWLQAFEYREYQIREQSRRQAVRFIPARRGEIRARHGDVLARNVPRHYLVYNLTEIEQCRRVAQRLARLVRSWGREETALLEEEPIYESLQKLRGLYRPWLGSDEDVPLHPWIRNLDGDLAVFLRAQIDRRPDRYPGVHITSEAGLGEIWIDAVELFAGEAATRRIDRALGFPPGTLYLGMNRDGTGGIWKRYQGAREDSDPNRRQNRFDMERVLVSSIPFELTAEISYHPETYPGIHLREGHSREYPAGLELAHILGQAGPLTAERHAELREDHLLLDRLTGLDEPRLFRNFREERYLSADWIGRSGLELRLDAELRGMPGARFVEIDGRGREVGEPFEYVEARDGEDIVLTMDLPLCRRVREIFLEQDVKAGSVLVGEPSTGEILAWVSHPSFDPATLRSDYPELSKDVVLLPLLDRPTRFRLPPGSAIKPAVALAGLLTDVITPETEYMCRGIFNPRFPDRLRCPNHTTPLTLRLSEALARSCNCYFYDLAQNKLGLESFYNYMKFLGFGVKTGVPVAEARGNLPTQSSALSSAAIGQGAMIVTPIQLFRFYCIVANRGLAPMPRLVLDPDAPPPQSLPIPRPKIEAVIEGMRGAVEYGSASDAEVGLFRYDCAVKTGTADRHVAGSDPHNVAWIVGLAPVEEPSLVFVVEIEQTDAHGGERAGPVVAAIFRWLEEERGYELRAEGSPRVRDTLLRLALRSSRAPSLAMLAGVLGLLVIGSLFVHSASASPGAGFPSVLAQKHLIRVFAGVALLVVFLGTHYRELEKIALPLYCLGVGALLWLLILKLTGQVRVARWIHLPGFTLQPSEVMKLFTILLVATLLKPRHRGRDGWHQLLPLAACALPVGLIALQPDLGTALVFLPPLVAMLWVSGISRRRLLVYFVFALALTPVAYWRLEPYQLNRISVFLTINDLRIHEESERRTQRKDEIASGMGYQINQSLIAIGSGGPTGKGLGQGPQNTLDVLPEEHNDFIFGVIGEEWGLVGTGGVILLFLFLYLAGLTIAYRTRDPFGRLVVTGIIVWLASQTLLNLAMTIGLAPVTGLPLPFVSFGGSSLLTTTAAMGIVIGVGMRPAWMMTPEGLRGGSSPVSRRSGIEPARRVTR